MSPEQLRGENVTPRSDIYAIGLIIYELFTGKRAWEAGSIPALIAEQEKAQPDDLTAIATDADPAVKQVILRCLHPDPLQRPQSALAVAAALPGGDPLAAALAAGEMPSPELVAASGKSGGIALRFALPMLVLVMIGLLAFPLARQGVYMTAIQDIEQPPAVLAAKSREVAAAFGYGDKPRDWHGNLYINYAPLQHFEKQPGAKDWSKLFGAELPYRYRYLQSPQLLISPPDGEITDERPALNVPGMVRIRLDTAGRLRSFDAVAPRWRLPTPEAGEPDIAEAFRLAGLDLSRFKPAAPMHVPPQPFDARKAWEGLHPHLPQLPITVEIASFQGKLTAFHIRYPWTETADLHLPRPTSAVQRVMGSFALVLFVTGFLCAVFFAHRNLKAGRGDRRGAVRITLVMFGLSVTAWLLRQHWLPHEAMFNFLVLEIETMLGGSALMGLLYLALEPAVRARWPHTLITWNRLLAGQFGDPRLGSHVLIGASLGIAISYLFYWRTYLRIPEGLAPAGQDLQIIQGPACLASALLGLLASAAVVGSVIFFVLCGVRFLLRYDWLAALAAALLLAFQEGGLRNSTNMWMDLPVYVLIFAALAFLLLRLGLVAAIASIFFINTVSRVPVPPDVSSWYTGYAVLILMVLMGIVAYAFARSQAPVERQGYTA